MHLQTDPAVDKIFRNYPEGVREKMYSLRNLILETAEETEDISVLEETLKWGEPSYLSPKGSTIRMDWKPKNPNQYAVYFKCTSKLVPTFRKFYSDTFKFEGNRALLFNLDDDVPVTALKHCFHLALRYHQLKQLEDLGINQD